MLDETKKRGRPPRLDDTRRICFHPPKEVFDQIEELAAALHVSRRAVIAQAIARWYDTEPLIQKRKTNGNGNP